MGRLALRSGKGATVIPSSIYDTRIGTGVSIDGYASLPIAPGARYIKLGPGGSDGASGLTHATRLTSLTEAANRITAGQGDQVLLAEGYTPPDSIPYLTFKSGLSAAHPTVFSSYDPTDENNTDKFGRGEVRSARPVITAHQGQVSGGGTYGNIAFVGLEWNPASFDLAVAEGINFIGEVSNVLVENCVGHKTGLGATMDHTGQYGPFIVRNSALFEAVGTGFFIDHADFTLEDSIMYHHGWPIGNSRDLAYGSGGLDGPGDPGTFIHTVYITPGYNGNAQAISRRNLIADGPGDSGTWRCSTLFEQNVVFDCPISMSLGGGDSYDVKAPSGVMLTGRYNACIGSQGTTTAAPRGYAMISQNGQSGSRMHHNLFARGQPSSPNATAISITSGYTTKETYMEVDNNVIDGWTTSGGGQYIQPSPLGDHVHYNPHDNWWDDPTSGSNQNISGLTRPNRYTSDTLAVLHGFADAAAMKLYMCLHPELRLQRTLLTEAFDGYGLDYSAM